MWGTTIRFGAVSSGSSAGSGSGSVTSSAAPAIGAVDQRLSERLLVDDRAARGVDQDRGRSHLRERAGVDQVVGLGRQRAVQRHEVGCSQQRPERVVVTGARVNHVHLEARGAPGDRRADPADADDPERGAVDLEAEVAVGLPRPPLAAAHRLDRLGQPARGREQQREGRGRRSRRSGRPACCRPGSLRLAAASMSMLS